MTLKRRKIQEIRIPAGHARAFMVKESQYLKIVDLEGGQVGDFIAFARDNFKEKLSPVHTRTSLLSLKVSVGQSLRSNLRNPMLEIVEDTVGCHDLLLAMCDERRYLVDYGVKNHRSCTANFEEALEPYGIGRHHFPDPFNAFQNTEIDPSGRLVQAPGLSRAGDYIIFRAHMDMIGSVSACPMDLNPIGGGKLSDLLVQIYED
jgi:uncharacterized protein YcgI (DUF1989 family)